MSFGSKTYSEILNQAVKAVEDTELSGISSDGEEAEVIAPGE